MQVCPTGALAEKGFAVEEMVKHDRNVTRLAGQARRPRMKKIRLATVWLDGCSGCHMSLLDMDEAILAVAKRVDVVYGPLVDAQEFPKAVDVTADGRRGQLAGRPGEGAAPSAQRSKLVVALGDCAVTGNVPAMRNQHPGAQAAGAHLRRRRAEATAEFPPTASRRCCARPCRCTRWSRWTCTCPAARRPPKAIACVLGELLEGRMPDLASKVKFG